ncbi:hypothetical protein PPYR_15134 [Photinus pyralis]|uniref:Ubiquitin-like modifier-activating enzyme ATG7 n=1 Tax=Photinus pyralis TaxID=7054 RepID=A0A5N3ZZH7_PHOPY|nr:ubiquitin-like modifier-activating enzyme ATG7 [Photinus pyralis]KAB0790475.1 hypothetical protein PPYR_15134 [Photinus pyralis]
MDTGTKLEYYPFSSTINPSFWHKLTEIKLDVDKLNEHNRPIWGYYSNLNLNKCKTSLFEVDSTSFNGHYSNQKVYIPVLGMLLNKNTIEQFKECDKNSLVQTEGKKLWGDIKSDKLLTDPFRLNSFLVLSFADLKKYHYYYWFCYLAPTTLEVKLLKITPIEDLFSNSINDLFTSYNELDIKEKPFFLLKRHCDGLQILPLSRIKDVNSANASDFYYGFSDPSGSGQHPGWPIRNYILLILHYCPFLQGSTVNLFAFRLSRSGVTTDCSHSLVFTTVFPLVNLDELMESDTAWIGWEKNERGKFGPRLSNMRNSIDPQCLAETAVDLNLKLIKWQLLPNINLEKIKCSKCLLLGSGTLGCSVARNLLAWSVRTITFVDNALVSFSNPVRQNLFTYEDCLESKTKADAAAQNLRKVFPGVHSKGYNLTIPMPGHPVGEILLDQTKSNVETLTELISTHDIIFLLMDSRESRWLPTLLGTINKKIVINAALGFDTYLVMRYGIRCADTADEALSCSTEGFKAIPGNKLGCYFCNDVTAPGNSLAKRTLDQQCTVTRPGVSAIASALAVELAVSILQHPRGASAPAFYKANNQDLGDDCGPEESILGAVPHSIRGFLSMFNHVMPATEKYKQCVACSDIVIAEYEASGFDFLLKVFNSCKYLEELTGLSDIHNEIGNLEVWDFDEINESD